MKKNLITVLIIFFILFSCKSDKSDNENLEIDTSLLYGVWAFNKSDPHAVFMINKDEYYLVDYDGDGSINYTLEGKELKIFYDGSMQWGKITSVTQDSLKIKWRDTDIETKYVRFPED